jgi:hypothetical protein
MILNNKIPFYICMQSLSKASYSKIQFHVEAHPEVSQ